MALRILSLFIACIYDVVNGLFGCELAIGIGCVPIFNCVSACCLVCVLFL